eukprot:scaffold160025_cov59-Attheya_sp.AAC.3
MANDRTVKAIDEMERLIDLCVPPEEVEPRRKILWERCVPKYRKAMLKLRQHADFTDDGIAEFQHNFDLFFQDCVELYDYVVQENRVWRSCQWRKGSQVETNTHGQLVARANYLDVWGPPDNPELTTDEDPGRFPIEDADDMMFVGSDDV